MKNCGSPQCKRINPQSLTNFKRDSHTSSGFSSYCKECCNYKRRNSPKEMEGTKRRVQVWTKNNPEKAKNIQLKINYGITIEDYNKILKDQNNKCAICINYETAGQKGKIYNLAVDHDHNTGKIRGLLCGNCNKTLGNAKDSVIILQSCIDYLNKNNT